MYKGSGTERRQSKWTDSVSDIYACRKRLLVLLLIIISAVSFGVEFYLGQRETCLKSRYEQDPRPPDLEKLAVELRNQGKPPLLLPSVRRRQ